MLGHRLAILPSFIRTNALETQPRFLGPTDWLDKLGLRPNAL